LSPTRAGKGKAVDARHHDDHEEDTKDTKIKDFSS